MKLLTSLFLLIFFIEATITTLPLVLLFLLVFSLIQKKILILTISFFSGIFLDIFSLRPVGGASLYFAVFFFLVFIYERKYETATFPFVFVASFLGSLGFILFLRQNFLATAFPEALLSACIALFAVSILNLKNTNKNNINFGGRVV